MQDSSVRPNDSEYESNINVESLNPPQTSIAQPPNLTLKDLEKLKKTYSRLIYMVAIVSGTQYMNGNVNFWYLTKVLKADINQCTFFGYYTGLMRNFKPILSLVSETVCPFHSRIKFYIILGSLMIFVSTLFGSIFNVDYWQLFTLNFFISLGYNIIELIVEGMTAEVVKIDTQISLLRSS